MLQPLKHNASALTVSASALKQITSAPEAPVSRIIDNVIDKKIENLTDNILEEKFPVKHSLTNSTEESFTKGFSETEERVTESNWKEIKKDSVPRPALPAPLAPSPVQTDPALVAFNSLIQEVNVMYKVKSPFIDERLKEPIRKIQEAFVKTDRIERKRYFLNHLKLYLEYPYLPFIKYIANEKITVTENMSQAFTNYQVALAAGEV